jgi:hypothetical protein
MSEPTPAAVQSPEDAAGPRSVPPATEASHIGSPPAVAAAAAASSQVSGASPEADAELLRATAAWPAEAQAARLARPWAMRGFFLARLPLALAAGLRVREIDRRRCVVTVPYGWRTTNPFRSTYFAALSMAAELTTGALAMLATRTAPSPVALLIVGLEASFGKKATATTTFTCADGDAIFTAVARAVASGEPAIVRAASVGRAPDGVEVARFALTWSFKRRAARPSATA